jgi:hypothetical protein
MTSERYHAELGAPEEEPIDGSKYAIAQKAVRITAGVDIRDLQLPQLDGLLVALD